MRSLLPCTLIHFEWTIEVLVGFHLMEPLLGIMLDSSKRPTHSELKIIFQNLYKQMIIPVEGIRFSSIERHALPALSDGFAREYKKTWLTSFQKKLEEFDADKLENAMQTMMKMLANCLSSQRGI